MVQSELLLFGEEPTACVLLQSQLQQLGQSVRLLPLAVLSRLLEKADQPVDAILVHTSGQPIPDQLAILSEASLAFHCPVVWCSPEDASLRSRTQTPNPFPVLNLPIESSELLGFLARTRTDWERQSGECQGCREQAHSTCAPHSASVRPRNALNELLVEDSPPQPRVLRVVRQAEVIGADTPRVVTASPTRETLPTAGLSSGFPLETIGRIAGGVAQEFDHLLTVISGYTALLLARPDTDHAVRSLLTQMRLAGDRATQLVQQLLATARLQERSLELLDLNETLLHLEGTIRSLLGQQIVLHTRFGADLPPVLADRSQIHRVVMNLVANAADAMPQGGTLTLETAELPMPHVHPASANEPGSGSFVVLRVCDTGCGLSDEARAHLFEPFFTTKSLERGRGLGLAAVQGIVTQNGGYIEVDSVPGAGCTFRVYLPARTRPAAPPPAPPSKITVLLVDANHGTRTLSGLGLRQQGYTVLEASGEPEALSLAAHHPDTIDLVIVDEEIPCRGNEQLARSLSLAHPALKVLTLRSDGLTPTLGNEFLLNKPFTFSALLSKVSEAVGLASR